VGKFVLISVLNSDLRADPTSTLLKRVKHTTGVSMHESNLRFTFVDFTRALLRFVVVSTRARLDSPLRFLRNGRRRDRHMPNCNHAYLKTN